METIITRQFDGKQRKLALACGLTPGQISKFLSGTQPLTKSTLAKICDHLTPHDARELSLACCRDLLPADIAEDLTIEEKANILAEPLTTYNQLDPKSEEILAKLRTLIRKDPETRDWLHHLASWIFPTSDQD